MMRLPAENDLDLIKRAAISALEDLLAVATSHTAWLKERVDDQLLADSQGLPNGRLAALTASAYLNRLGWTVDAERLPVEMHNAFVAVTGYIHAVAHRDSTPEERESWIELLGWFPVLPPSSDEQAEELRHLLAIKAKSVVAKLFRHVERVTAALHQSLQPVGHADSGEVSLKDIERVTGLSKKTITNNSSKLKLTDPCPAPTSKSQGSIAARYPYAEFRAWFLRNWPESAEYLPERYSDFCKKLS